MLNYYNIRDVAIRILNPFVGLEALILKRNETYIYKYQVVNQTKKECCCLLIGDSHTYALNNFSLPSDIINIGIKGDTTKGVQSRTERNISNIKYTTAILQLGYNDFKFRSVKNTCKNYASILKKLNGKIYCVSLFPVSANRSWANKKIIKFNTWLKANCFLNDCKYLNFFEVIYSKAEKGINPLLTYDGVHLNESGNKLYIDFIQPFFYQ